MVPGIIPVLVFFYFSAGSTESCANSNLPLAFHYNIAPCTNNTSLLQRQILKRLALPTELTCAYQCYLELDCRHAIFLSGSFESCYLASNVKDEEISVSDFTSSITNGFCSILKINPPIRCNVNTSIPGQFSCSCPDGYFGRYCEEVVSSYCQTNNWVTSDFHSINSSGFQVKFLIQINSLERYDFEIHNVDDVFIVPHAAEKICEFHSLLAWNATDDLFLMPPQLVFSFTNVDLDNMVTEYLSLDGVILDEKIEDHYVVTAFLITENPINTERLTGAFHEDPGSFERLANGLSKGHRLVHREAIRVEFDSLNRDVIFESLAGKSLVLTNLDPQVRAYATYKQTFRDSKRFITEFSASTGTVLNERSEHHNEHIWALDDCWGPLQQVDDIEELTGMLRETLLMGKDVRIVLGDSISSDVLQVTLSNRDVVAALAPYIAPLDNISRLGDGNAIYSLISTHRILSTCEMIYQAGVVVQRETTEYLSPIQWIISKRTWKKILLLNNYGDTLFGDLENLRQAASWGRNIRVCIQYSNIETTCIGGKSLTVKRINVPVTVIMQSRSVIRPAFNGDGVLNGIGDDECRRTELLISSDGWVKSVVYVEGNTNYENDDSVHFETMTWFEEL